MEELRKQFFGPSGFQYEIREENGADEEILSNLASIKKGTNISEFISAIVVDTNFTESGKLTVEDVLNLPMLDRYAILLQSRIFSLGNMLEFVYEWPNIGPVRYEQDLEELIFEDYGHAIPEEEKKAKPNALPVYPDLEVAIACNFKDYEVTLSTGKTIKFDYLNGNSEKYLLGIPEDKQTRNSDLMARNLHLKVGNHWDRVEKFSVFSIKEMAEMRKVISELDPVWLGLTEVENPETGEINKVPVMAQPRFFYLTEA